MKAVITGFDSRACREATGKKHLSFGYLIGELLVSQGFSVHQHECWPEDPSCREHLRTADLIFVGISSPLALTSHYALNAMAVLYKHADDERLRLFVDDPNVAKIGHGSASAARRWFDENKDPLFTDNRAFQRRPRYDEAEKAKQQFYEVCQLMMSWKDIAPTFAPVSHTFGDYGLSAQQAGVVPLDVTSAALSQVDNYFDIRPKSRAMPRKTSSWYVDPWVVGGSKWAEGVTTTRDKVSYPVSGWKTKLETVVTHYGVLESPKSRDIAGWWSVVPVLSAVGRQFYATSLSEVRAFNHPESGYYVLPYVYETLGVVDQQEVINSQIEELFNTSPSSQIVSDVLLSKRSEVSV